MTFSGVVAKPRLEEADVVAIKALEETVNRQDAIQIKFNWSMMLHRDGEGAYDFCYYHEGDLVGYMPLDGFGESYEITGAVLPAFRRQGIFQRLYEAACQEARTRRAKKLLLVNYRASQSGTAVVQRLGIPYDFSEYHMEADTSGYPTATPSREEELRLAAATPSDLEEVAHLLTVIFGKSAMHTQEALAAEIGRENERFYLAKVKAETIGEVGVLISEPGVYIRAVGILPEWRGRGYGRQLLAAVVRQMMAEGHSRFELDVATENSSALALYQSCGFHETIVYDYYTVSLTERAS